MALLDPPLACPDLDAESLEYAPDFGSAGLRAWLRDPRMSALLEYWNDKRGVQRCTRASAVDLLEIPDLAGWTVLVDCPVWGGTGVFRSVGAQIVELAGLDITGRPMTDLPDPVYRRMFEENCDAVRRTAMPLASRYVRVLDGRRLAFERLDLPLLDQSSRVATVLVGMAAAAGA